MSVIFHASVAFRPRILWYSQDIRLVYPGSGIHVAVKRRILTYRELSSGHLVRNSVKSELSGFFIAASNELIISVLRIVVSKRALMQSIIGMILQYIISVVTCVGEYCRGSGTLLSAALFGVVLRLVSTTGVRHRFSNFIKITFGTTARHATLCVTPRVCRTTTLIT